MTTIQAIIIAIVEGLTEFLPISSTGHMIITSAIMKIQSNEFTKVFEVAIQLGAILAVVAFYWKKFMDFKNPKFYVKLILAVIPALVLGFLLGKQIDKLLESPTTVAISFIVGGIVLLFIDRLFNQPTIVAEEQITNKNAVSIGFYQCIAMIPGVSRSAASIIGGMSQKLTRSLAAEFSFFLAVPTMLAATAYKLLKYYKEQGSFTAQEIKLLTIGNMVAFVVALVAIRFFIVFLQKHGFKSFGYYRIIVGVILLILIAEGYIGT